VTELRASDADRDRTVTALRHHAAAGRLTLDELDERTERAYSAKTMRELVDLQADLPDAVVRPARRRRRPMFPGRYGFTLRWHAPTNATITMTELMADVVPPLERFGYDLVQRFDNRLRFEREIRPAWTIAVAVLMFPIGLVALVHKDRERITIDLTDNDRGCTVIASGVAPLPVRRAFAELED
jgi:hypothetical protein